MMLHHLRQRSCENALERINVLYGVYRDLNIDIPEPDYRRSVEQFYEDVTFHLSQYTRSLKVIEFANCQTTLERLPKWVPDFSNPPQSMTTLAYSHGIEQFPEYFVLQKLKGKLKIPGLEIGQVQSIGNRLQYIVGVMPSVKDEACWLLALYQWLVHLRHPQCSYELSHEGLFKYFTTLLRLDCQRFPSSPLEAFLTTLASLHMALERAFSPFEISDPTSPPDLGDREFGEVIGRFWLSPEAILDPRGLNKMLSRSKFSKDRMVLFTTEYGNCGLTTGQIVIDDVVVLFPGATVPMILRKVPGGVGEFEFVSPASISMISPGQRNIWRGGDAS